MRYTVGIILTALVLSSCSHKNEAMELSRNSSHRYQIPLMESQMISIHYMTACI